MPLQWNNFIKVVLIVFSLNQNIFWIWVAFSS